MDKKFSTDAVSLSQLLDQAASGRLQLPDFQRGWVWDDVHIASLLTSVMLAYPIGTVMTLRTGNPDVRFRCRTIEGVGEADREAELLLLDGQQRTTSLFLALRSPDPVPTRDPRGRKLLRHYYVDLARVLDEDSDPEEWVRSVPEGRLVASDFGRKVELDLRTREAEIRAGMFPLDIVLDGGEVYDWSMDYADAVPEDLKERRDAWKRFSDRVVKPFQDYQVPTIQLSEDTPKEAVCQVFEKVNTGGVVLTVFELLTATFAADDLSLRDDWATRRARFADYPVLKGFAETDFLQVVALLATYDRRAEHLRRGDEAERAPPVSCKRRDVLRLTLEDYRRWAPTAEAGVQRVAPFMHEEFVFRHKDLPYATQLVPLAAIFGVLGKDATENHATSKKLRQWLWCGVFGELYGSSTETRFANDLVDCVRWIEGGGELPRTVRDAQFQSDRLLTLRTRNSAAYKGLYALQMKAGARDFRTGNRIDSHAFFDDNIDIHHIFPKAWCAKQDVEPGRCDSVINKSAIDASTNRRIGGNAPSAYLRTIEGKGVSPEDLDEILASHSIDTAALRTDDFERFFEARAERLLGQIEEATGKPVNRTGEREPDGAFVDLE